MAVERIKQFSIDLAEAVETRVDAFNTIRTGIRAREEANFQRSIVDNDLAYEAQLNYRKEQLAIAKAEIFPDQTNIDELTSSVSYLKKMTRNRKFRDEYFSFLQELASGKKSLEDHISFLESAIETTTDIDIKDELNGKLLEATAEKRIKDRTIIDSQIEFNTKDKTNISIQTAIDAVQLQLTKPDIIKDASLKNSYELQLSALNKDKLEISIEDKMNGVIINLISQDRTNSSLYKINTFSNFINTGGVNTPVNIGGVRYDSESEYWQTTLNDYIQNQFAGEYIAENEKQAGLTWNKYGIMSNSYLDNLTANNNALKTNKNLANFQDVITSAIQGSIASALDYKAKDITAKYYLGQPDLATLKNYNDAKLELENLKVKFGDDYSLSPAITQLEAQIVSKKAQMTGDILKTAAERAEEEGITLEEAIRKYGIISAIEVDPAVFKDKTPLEAATDVAQESKDVEALAVKKEETETKIKETQAKIDEAKGKKTPEVTDTERKELPFPKNSSEMEIYQQRKASGEIVWDPNAGTVGKWFEVKGKVSQEVAKAKVTTSTKTVSPEMEKKANELLKQGETILSEGKKQTTQVPEKITGAGVSGKTYITASGAKMTPTDPEVEANYIKLGFKVAT